MKWFLRTKEAVKPFIEKYRAYVNALFKFTLAFVMLLVIIYHTGYNTTLSSPFIAAGIACVCALVSHALIPVFMAILLIAEFVSVSTEAALMLIIILALMLLLYFVFKAGSSWLMPVSLTLCLLGAPGVMLPIALLISPVQVVPVAFGILLYGFVIVVKRDVSVLTGQTGSFNAAGRVNYLLNDLFSGKYFLLIMLCVCLAMIIISMLKRSKMNYAGIWAALTGDFLFVVGMLAGSYFMSVNINYISFAISMVVNALMMFLIIVFTFNLDYKRVEMVQFEDDEYYYYVKAIPKTSIAATEKKVETVTDEEPAERMMDTAVLFVYRDEEKNREEE